MSRFMKPGAATLKTNVPFYMTGIGLICIFSFPVIWVLAASFKTEADGRSNPMSLIPSVFTLSKYTELWNSGAGAPTYILNSVIVSVITVVVTVVVSTLAGYAFARFRFPFKNTIFFIILMKLMVPFPSLLTPLFMVLQTVGLNNSLIGIALIYVTFQLPFSVFVMRNAMEAIPKEMVEAAEIDGAGVLSALRYVLLPIALPGVATVALFAFLASWNEFLASLIFLSDGQKFTLPVMLLNAQTNFDAGVNWGAVEAGVVISMIPCLAVFLLLQKYYVGGLMSGAVK